METKEVSVVTIDTASIQRYVFASNKLKENIGASYIIEELLYKELMINCIRKAADEPNADLQNEWQVLNAGIALNDPNRKAEIGYIGGGNAMVLFSQTDSASAFISLFSLEVLRHFPGIRVVFGKTEATLGALMVADQFSKLRTDLKDSMRACSNEHYMLPSMFKPGIAEDCPSSNDTAEFASKGEGSETVWISGSTEAKLLGQEQALEAVKKHYKIELGERYTLTNEIEKLGQKKDKGYVAIVHADGNGIGNKFNKAPNLIALRGLSVKVSGIADKVMKKLIAEVVRLMDLDEADAVKRNTDREFPLDESDGKLILPIRPILAAGDDITLVCEGRLGGHLAAKVLEYFEEHQIGDLVVSACAGVAICKTHYPFFKAYHLAEELIHLSKETAKRPENRGENGKVNSWLHFLAMPSGFNGDLEDVIKSQFTVNGQPLLCGPYPLKGLAGSYDQLVRRLNYYLQIGEDKGWPRSKLMEMRDTFRLDESSQKLFIKEADARGLSFFGESAPDVLLKEKNDKPEPPEHMIYDLIQLADFYPDILKESPKPKVHEN